MTGSEGEGEGLLHTGVQEPEKPSTPPPPPPSLQNATVRELSLTLFASLPVLVQLFGMELGRAGWDLGCKHDAHRTA